VRREGRHRSDRSSGSWDLLSPIAYLGAGLAAIFVLIAAAPNAPPRPEEKSDRDEALRDLIAEQTELPRHWREAMQMLCDDPVLQAEGIAPDCLSGTITLGDSFFDQSDRVELNEEGIRRLHLAIDATLRALRSRPLVWQSLESIELRGHADPRARRNPYLTNMRVSQRRPMAIMLYLISDWALSERDRSDLERLLVLSAASYSRPPRSCPERSNECYRYWRRVEITPRLSDASLAADQARFTDELTALLPPTTN